MLRYTLYHNNFTTDDTEDRVARPVDVPVNTRKDLIRDITGPGSILKPTESNAVIDNYWGTIAEYTRRGEAYSDEYISTRFGIKGFFQNNDDEFDPTRHTLQISIVPKDPVSGVVAEVQVRKVEGGRLVPEIEHIFDWGSETTDDRLTPGDALRVTGTRLKVYDNLE